ncbi:MAG: DUF547 domain-containing protein, partial [Pseudomonadota bacterium]
MMPTRRHVLALAAAAAVTPATVAAGPASRLIDDRWTRFGSAGDPDHSAWATILQKHLATGTPSGVNLFDYAAADRGAIGAYVDALTAVAPTGLSRDAAMAYWLNLYNAATVWVVLEEYPVDSIKE